MQDQDLAIDLSRVSTIAWKHKRIFILLTLVGILAGGAIYAFLPRTYESTVVMLPVSPLGADRASPLDQVLNASGLGATGGSAITFYVEFVNSFDLHASFLSQNNYVSEFLEEVDFQKLPKEARKEPLWSAVKKFQKSMSVSHDRRTNVLTVSCRHQNRDFAAELANKFAAFSNALIQKRELEKLQRQVAYIESLLDEETISERRQVLLNIMEKSISRSNIISSDKEFAFRIIDYAVPDYGNDIVGMIIFVSLFGGLGFLVSIVVVLWVHFGRTGVGATPTT